MSFLFFEPNNSFRNILLYFTFCIIFCILRQTEKRSTCKIKIIRANRIRMKLFKKIEKRFKTSNLLILPNRITCNIVLVTYMDSALNIDTPNTFKKYRHLALRARKEKQLKI